MSVLDLEHNVVWYEYSEQDMALAKDSVAEIFKLWRSMLTDAVLARPLFDQFSRSLFMFAVYKVSRTPSGAAGITQGSLRRGLTEFRGLLDANGLELYSEWLEKAEEVVVRSFQLSSKAFESHIVGTLCDRLHLSDSDAQAVLDELEKRGKVHRVGTKFGTPLLALN